MNGHAEAGRRHYVVPELAVGSVTKLVTLFGERW